MLSLLSGFLISVSLNEDFSHGILVVQRLFVYQDLKYLLCVRELLRDLTVGSLGLSKVSPSMLTKLTRLVSSYPSMSMINASSALRTLEKGNLAKEGIRIVFDLLMHQ